MTSPATALPTAQEIFDTVALHLWKQQRPGGTLSGGGFSCTYLASDGSKCAVGCLLSEKEAREADEYGLTVGNVRAWEAMGEEKVETIPAFAALVRTHGSLLARLQQHHDLIASDHPMEYFWLHMRPALAKIANEFRLRLPEFT